MLPSACSILPCLFSFQPASSLLILSHFYVCFCVIMHSLLLFHNLAYYLHIWFDIVSFHVNPSLFASSLLIMFIWVSNNLFLSHTSSRILNTFLVSFLSLHFSSWLFSSHFAFSLLFPYSYLSMFNLVVTLFFWSHLLKSYFLFSLCLFSSKFIFISSHFTSFLFASYLLFLFHSILLGLFWSCLVSPCLFPFL